MRFLLLMALLTSTAFVGAHRYVGLKGLSEDETLANAKQMILNMDETQFQSLMGQIEHERLLRPALTEMRMRSALRGTLEPDAGLMRFNGQVIVAEMETSEEAEGEEAGAEAGADAGTKEELPCLIKKDPNLGCITDVERAFKCKTKEMELQMCEAEAKSCEAQVSASKVEVDRVTKEALDAHTEVTKTISSTSASAQEQSAKAGLSADTEVTKCKSDIEAMKVEYDAYKEKNDALSALAATASSAGPEETGAEAGIDTEAEDATEAETGTEDTEGGSAEAGAEAGIDTQAEDATQMD